MLMQFLVGFTDVFIAGRINSHLQGALGIITQCQFFFMVFGIALVNGGLASMSQSLGAGLALRASRYTGLLFKLAAFFCALTILLGKVFAKELLLALQVPGDIFALSLELWDILIWIMPASYLSFATIAVFRSRKEVWVPLASSMVVCLVNGLADYGLGLGKFGLPELGGQGLIYASIISMSAGALFNLGVLIKKKLVSRRSFAPFRWERKAIPYIIKVALPAGGSQLLWQLGYLMLFLITNTLPSGGTMAASGLTVGMRIEAVLFLPAMAFSFTGSILVGHCLGAGNKAEAKRVGLRVVGAGALSMSVLAGCMLPFVARIAALVTPLDLAVQDIATSYMMFNLLAVPFTVTSMIMSGIFSGAGATLYSLMAFSFGTWVVRLPLAWYMGHEIWRGPDGIFVAMLVSQVVQALFCLFLFLRKDWYRFASTARRFSRGAPRRI
ncbi:MATE family efflux transporter [Desulfovibrio sp. OttesenSCG-928-A18]|nr:MATE family efflux transporter [Desulfovibrio sp. OttesenSCG-928-A18]